ncbi:NAD(P)-dependent oxidoreductase [Pontibacillus salicampi]|uniref:NAD(P)-dependent oxidoreductase n=1 Tax=Pontibacillus salicampi TaxID=1449801 RepID=A0ABV6LMC6_9BACI
MNITIFGATGRVGSKLTNLLLEQGHHVRALVRNQEKAVEVIPHAELIIGDVRNEGDVQKAIRSSDAVVSALGTDRTTTLSEAIPIIIRQMMQAGINRIVTIGTAGILDSRYEADKYRFQSSESKRTKTFAAEEHLSVYQTLQNTNFDWTIICPTYLPDGDAEGSVRFEENLLPIDGKKVTTGDTAVFTYETLLNNSFSQKRVGICY